MPWRLKKKGSGWVVVTVGGPNAGHEHSKQPLPRARALDQLRALYANNPGEARAARRMSGK